MKLGEYRDYEQAVAQFFEKEGINCLTSTHGQWEGDYEEFSVNPCDCCGSTLGGERYDCGGYNPTTGEVQEGYRVCPDCIHYAAYGQLDDMTMMDMEDDLEEQTK